MTFATSDLASVLVAPDREFAGFSQGIIRAWDPETFENVVSVRGADLTNLQVMAGVEALTYAPGDVVMLGKWRPSGGGMASYWVMGRAVSPGADRAADTIAFLQSGLAKQLVNSFVEELLVSPAGQTLAAFVLGQRVHADFVAVTESRNNAAYGNLTTVGPTVSSVPVSDAGTAICLVSAQISANLQGGLNEGGHVGVEVSGATSRAPVDFGEVRMSSHTAFGGDTDAGAIIRTAGVAVFNDLNPGTHQFQLKYRRLTGGSSAATFGNRSLVVIAL